MYLQQRYAQSRYQYNNVLFLLFQSFHILGFLNDCSALMPDWNISLGCPICAPNSCFFGQIMIHDVNINWKEHRNMNNPKKTLYSHFNCYGFWGTETLILHSCHPTSPMCFVNLLASQSSEHSLCYILIIFDYLWNKTNLSNLSSPSIPEINMVYPKFCDSIILASSVKILFYYRILSRAIKILQRCELSDRHDSIFMLSNLTCKYPLLYIYSTLTE